MSGATTARTQKAVEFKLQHGGWRDFRPRSMVANILLKVNAICIGLLYRSLADRPIDSMVSGTAYIIQVPLVSHYGVYKFITFACTNLPLTTAYVTNLNTT